MNVQDMWLQAQMQKQGGMPGPSNPALLAAAQHQAASPSRGNPLNAGALAAMHSTRQALSEKPRPQHGMMGGMLNSLGETLQNVGIAKLRGSHRAPTAHLGNMMQTPHEMEEANYKKNADLLNFLSKQAEAQQHAEYKNAVLAEQRRYHDITAGQRASMIAARGAKAAPQEFSVPGLDLSQFPSMKSAKERGIYANSLNGATEARELILRSLKNLDTLEKENEGGLIDPTGSMIPGANRISNALTRGTAKGKKQFELRNILNSDFSQLEILLERTLKGGVPDAQTIKRLHEEQVYPGLGQPVSLNRRKLEENLKKIDARIKSDQFSLATGKHIPRDIFDTEEEAAPEAGSAQQTPLSGISTEDLTAELQKLKGGA